MEKVSVKQVLEAFDMFTTVKVFADNEEEAAFEGYLDDIPYRFVRRYEFDYSGGTEWSPLELRVEKNEHEVPIPVLYMIVKEAE